MGIAGFNDMDVMAAAVPTLTSVRTHRYEMGKQAIAMVEAAIAGNRPKEPVVDLGFELMARQSTVGKAIRQR
jgi:LacI family gluconate utilization system Gnt-I transcriptional repressor